MFSVVLYPLLEHGVKVTDDLLRAVEHNFLEAVKLLCEFALHLKVPCMLILVANLCFYLLSFKGKVHYW